MASGQDGPSAPYGGRPWRGEDAGRDARAHERKERSAEPGFFDGPAPEDARDGEGRAFGPAGSRDRGEAPRGWGRAEARGPGPGADRRPGERPDDAAVGREPDWRSPRAPAPPSARRAEDGIWRREPGAAGRGDPYGFDAFGVPSDYNFRGGRRPADGDVSSERVRPGQARRPGPFGSERDAREDRRRAESRAGAEDRPSGGQGAGGARRDPRDERPGGPQAAPRRTVWEEVRDEVSAWLGDEGAARRRRQDEETHRGRGPAAYVRSEARVKEDVCDLLSEDPILDASGIEVRVEGNEVTLDGRVRRREDKRRAEDLAERVYGVAHVQNNLRLEDDGSAGAARP